MLDSLRNGIAGWIAKIFLVLLVLSFAVWGIGDVIRTSGRTPTDSVAKVGGRSVSIADVQRDFDISYRRLQQQYGGALDRTQAINAGLMAQSLQNEVQRRLIDEHATSLGLTTADATLADMIRKDPLFQGPQGFDRSRFDMVLRQMGQTEDGYLATLRADQTRDSLVRSIVLPAKVPVELAKELATYRGEKRTGRVLLVTAGKLPLAAEPTDADLTAYLEKNQDAYQAPAYRSFVLASARPDDLVGEITIPDEDIRADYEARKADFALPERRHVEQLLTQDENTATQAQAAAATGKSLAEVATAMQPRNVRFQDLGEVRAGSLPAPLDGTVQAAAVGQVTAPVKSAFGWHVFKVKDILPASTETFEAKRDALSRELALAKAADQLPGLGNALEDALAAGTPFEKAAADVGFKVSTITDVDADGLGKDGKKVEDPRLDAEILKQAFATPEGQATQLLDDPAGGYFVLRVDHVEDARPRKLDEVRGQVVAAWRAEQQTASATTLAKDLLTKAEGGTSFADLAKDNSALSVVDLGPVLRSDDGPLGQQVVLAMFETAAGKVAKAPVKVAEGEALVAVDSIQPADAAPDTAPLMAELSDQIQQDLLFAYDRALRNRFPVQIDQGAFANLVKTDTE